MIYPYIIAGWPSGVYVKRNVRQNWCDGERGYREAQ